jgi:NAD(P)-dependent dehydrogenase (short-subunit alcohol dehydrogenase family)
VTGAGGAIGRAVSIRLAADGHSIAALDNHLTSAEKTVEMISERGGTAIAIGCDLRHEHEIRRSFAEADRALGPIEVLVNNAAVFPSGPFVEVSVAELDDTVAVNQRAAFLCAQLAARSMIVSGRGSIVNIASITWHGGWSDISPYVATKGALVAMTRALATELGPHGVRVNAVAPGAFPTAAERAQHDDLESYERRILSSQALPRRGTVEELAAVVSFFAGPEASFVTGQTLNVDGGWIMS